MTSCYFTSTFGAHMGDKRTVCTVLVGKPKGKAPLGRSGHSWKDTITIFVKELGWEVMAWSSLSGWGQEGSCCGDSAGNLLTGGGTGSLSRWTCFRE
jgi:hypothetical protein